MDNQQATIAEKAWLAGIFDGEGWIGFSIAFDDRSNSRRTVVIKTEVRVNNCDKAIIDKLSRIWKKIGVNPYRRDSKRKGVHRRVYEAATKHMTGSLKLLEATLPYLTGNKKERAELMIEFIKRRKKNGTIRIADENYPGYGPRNRTAPYTQREVEIVEECRILQAGASETRRENQDKAVQEFKIRNQKYKELLEGS